MKKLETRVASYLRVHYSPVYQELKSKKQKLKKVVKYLRAHKKEPHLLVAKFFRYLIKKIVIGRQNFLDNKIGVLQKKCNEYRTALEELKKGNKAPAIEVLKEIKQGMLFYNFSADSEGSGLIPHENPFYTQVSDLITELSAA